MQIAAKKDETISKIFSTTTTNGCSLTKFLLWPPPKVFHIINPNRSQFSSPPCAPDFKMAVKFKRRWQVNKKVKKKGKIFIFFSEAFFFFGGEREGGREEEELKQILPVKLIQ